MLIGMNIYIDEEIIVYFNLITSLIFITILLLLRLIFNEALYFLKDYRKVKKTTRFYKIVVLSFENIMQCLNKEGYLKTDRPFIKSQGILRQINIKLKIHF